MIISLYGTATGANPSAKTLTIKARNGGEVALEVTPETRPVRDHQVVGLGGLRIGDRTIVRYRVANGRLIAVRIRARSR